MKKRIIIATILILAIIGSFFTLSACEKEDDAFIYSGSSIIGLTDYGKTLSSVTIPYSYRGVKVSVIDTPDFFVNDNLKRIYYEGTLADWCSITFGYPVISPYGSRELYIQGERLEGDITIPDGVKSINDCAFANCIDIKSVTIPQGVTSIGRWAFISCSSLTSVSIPDGVNTIGDSAFFGTGLLSLTIPDSVTFIDKSAFFETAISEVVIPSNVEEVGNSAFNNCSNLTSVKWQAKASVVDTYTFFGCSNLTDVELSLNVKKIGECAFGRSGLSQFPQGGSIKEISKHAFIDCENLKSANLPEGLRRIENEAFKGCVNLQRAYIPQSVRYVGGYAFEECSDAILNYSPNCQIALWSPYWAALGGTPMKDVY